MPSSAVAGTAGAGAAAAGSFSASRTTLTAAVPARANEEPTAARMPTAAVPPAHIKKVLRSTAGAGGSGVAGASGFRV